MRLNKKILNNISKYNLLSDSRHIRFYNDITSNKKFLLPHHLQNDADLDKYYIEDPNKIKLIKGFTFFDDVLHINRVTSSHGIRKRLISESSKHISSLDNDQIYSFLTMLVSRNSESEVKIYSIFEEAKFICSLSSSQEVSDYIIKCIKIAEMKYNIEGEFDLVVLERVWLRKSNLINKELFTKALEIVVNMETKYKDIKGDKENDIFLKNTVKNILKDSFHSILTPKIIENLPIINCDFSYTLRKVNLEEYPNAVLLSFYHNENEIIHNLMENGFIIDKWIDYIVNNKNKNILICRDNQLGLQILYNYKSKISIVELKYNYPRMLEIEKDHIHNNNIGVINLETLSIDDDGSQTTYAGGWSIGKESNLYYLNDNNINSSKELILKIFTDIFNSEYKSYTFYAHNLSNFDSIFIMDALSSSGLDFELKPILNNENNLISLNIKYKLLITDKNKKITVKILLLDSNLMLNCELGKLSEDFNCIHKKTHFPYQFMNYNNLNYIGPVPKYEYFNSIKLSKEEYHRLYDNIKIYDIKKEALNYLNNNLLSLHEILTKFSDIVYNDFSINTVEHKTYSSLSLAIFRSNFHDFKNNITMIRGQLEKEIRKAYFGGLVYIDKNANKVNNVYLYDVVSQYPSVMLKDMPVGNPKLSNDKDLNSYFGFCYVNVIPPKDLKCYIIPYRDKNGSVTCPSKPFSGIYFSELLKESIKYGYKIECKGGIKFDRCENIFKNFVETLFNNRLKAKELNNSSFDRTYKLILNSLYGRFGMKEILNKCVIVNKNEAKFYLDKKNVVLVSDLNDKVLIKYNENINKELIDLINSDVSYIDKNTKKNSLVGKFKQRGVPSSIQIAAAVTAYSQIEMMKFKNMSDNKLLYHDTDSLVMANELSSDYINPKILGMLKYEHEIKEGYFISPKFYAFTNSLDEIIIKTKGLKENVVKYQDIVDLSNGKDKDFDTMIFRKNLQKGTVNIRKTTFKIKGVSNNNYS
jgi:hypothetical protein